jgi:hypothetical protein
MKRKPEIFDVVFYYNEKNTLEKRIKYLENEVSKFFIVNFSKTSVEIDNPKVEDIFFDGDFDFFLTWNNLNEFKEFFIDSGVKFTDILLFSKTNEVPDISKFTEFESILKKGEIVLKQTKVFWNQYYTTPDIHLGTRVMYLTHLAQNLRFIPELFSEQYPIFLGPSTKESGWVLFGFDDNLEESTESFKFWNNLKTESWIIQNKLENCRKSLIEPLLKKKPLTLIKNKKSLLPNIFDVENELNTPLPKRILLKFKDEITPLSVFDHIFEIQIGKIIFLGNKTHTFEIPENSWYPHTEDFQMEYSINEVQKLLRNLQFHDWDEIHIKKTDAETSVLSFREFKKKIPSKLFKTLKYD